MAPQPNFTKGEPSFDDLGKNPNPDNMRPLPEDRVDTLFCFVESDDAFFREVEKLKHAVVFHNPPNRPLDPARAVAIAVDTGLVREREIRVASLANGRTLIHLPRGLRVETFIKALPAFLWEEGLSIQPWSQVEGADVEMPRFKLLLDLIDFPIHVWREQQISKVVSGIGVYLGSVPPLHSTDYSYRRVAVATSDLRKVPRRLAMVIGGLKHYVPVRPIAWETGPIYAPSDFPTPPQRFSRPAPASKKNPVRDDDMIYCSRRALLEICASLNPESIPSEIGEIMVGRKTHGEVPLQMLHDLVDSSGNQRDPMQPMVYRPRMCDLSQKVPNSELASPKVTQESHRETQDPEPTGIIHEDQPRSEVAPLKHVATNPALWGSDAASVKQTESQVPVQKKDKGIITEQGQTSDQHIHKEAGQIMSFTAQKGITIKEPCVARSQKIPTKDKDALAARTALKACTSTHARFRGQVGKEKARSRASHMVGQKPKESDSKQVAIPSNPQRISSVDTNPMTDKKKLRKPKATRADPSNLINVPIQVVAGSIDGPTSQQAVRSTPTKRKTMVIPSSDQVTTPKEPAKKINEQATFEFSATGFYEVSLPAEHCQVIGKGCGVHTSEVIRALEEDNEARKNAADTITGDDLSEELDWEELARFEPDPEDDLDLNMEVDL